MTIWAYLIIGVLEMIRFWMMDISSTNPCTIKHRIILSVLSLVAWPLEYLLMVILAIWCRIKPEHRLLIDIVEK